ncbi:hypothetical protein EVAR_13532_1 [Eumeta japonica]|uniref:Uncharacterized protein n=1 Tax=Eumeta variegata TaxID=151549 RepID=A0A4C1U8Q7_EUMVA|nr:hypothetical protein EVAR_13532_1 [Eumeta japonica]
MRACSEWTANVALTPRVAWINLLSTVLRIRARIELMVGMRHLVTTQLNFSSFAIKTHAKITKNHDSILLRVIDTIASSERPRFGVIGYKLNQSSPDLKICPRSEAVTSGHFVSRIFHTPFLAGAAGDEKELSVGTPTSSSNVTTVSGSDSEVVGSPLRSNRRNLTMENLDDAEKLRQSHTCVGTAMLFYDIDSGPCRNGRRYLATVNEYRQRSAALPS